jgi:hypothetical protein
MINLTTRIQKFNSTNKMIIIANKILIETHNKLTKFQSIFQCVNKKIK